MLRRGWADDASESTDPQTLVPAALLDALSRPRCGRLAAARAGNSAPSPEGSRLVTRGEEAFFFFFSSRNMFRLWTDFGLWNGGVVLTLLRATLFTGV